MSININKIIAVPEQQQQQTARTQINMLIYSYVAEGCRNAKHKQTKGKTHKTSVGSHSGKFRCSLLGVQTHIHQNHLCCVLLCGPVGRWCA